MIDDPAVADLLEEHSDARGPSRLGQIMVFALLTVFAAGAGFGTDLVLENMRQSAADQLAADDGHGEQTAKHGDGHGQKTDAHDDAMEEKPVGELTTVELPEIITNLAAPSDTWVRLEMAVRFHGGAPEPSMIEDIHQDMLAFVRTMRLEQIGGPSGFMHFKSDLAERAAIRSEGTAKGVLIKVLLFE